MDETIHLTNMTDLPLSSDQKRLWVISRLDKFNPSYNLSYTYYFNGKLNYGLFQKSIDVLFERHHTMFSTFKEVNGEPYCDIKPRPAKIASIDFSDYSIEKGKENAASFVAEDKRKLFDIEQGPLYRLYLIKLSEINFYFHVTFHHIIFDAWSWGVFVQDFNRIYNNLLRDQEEILEPIEFFSYDYASLEKKTGIRKSEEELINFWKEYLKDSPPALKFPYDYPRNNNTGLGGSEDILIPENITSGLKKISQEERISVFRIILSALGILYQKYTCENDICIGTFVADRSKPGIGKIFGMFVDTLPIRFKINEDITFKKYLNHARDFIHEAIAHKDLPFDRIVDAAKTDRILYTNPLFQVALSWWTNLIKPMELGGVSGEWVTIRDGVSPFDINFHLWEDRNCIIGEIEFNIDKLERRTIIRLKESFIQLLHSIVENLFVNISEHNITTEKDLKFINKLNNTDVPYENNLCIHQKFEKQIEITPDATALLMNSLSLSYRELNEHANRMANYLIRQDVKIEDKVGICMDRSAEMMICIFGVLKAGSAYLPLDPAYPLERLKIIIKDASPKLILTTRVSSINIPEGNQLVIVDDIIKNPLSEISLNPNVKVTSKNLAYVIYTSGSTGTPKGVMIEHHSVLNRLGWMQKAYPISKTDTLLQKTPISFDVSVWELFWWSFNGARLVLLPKGGEKNPEIIVQYINDYKVTTIHFVPSMFVALFEMIKARQLLYKLKSLNRIFMSGEVLPLKLVKEFNEMRAVYSLPGLINLYGPTEATVDVSYFNCPEADIKNVYIGRPIDNTKLFVLNDKNIIQPIGAPGELIITGVNLARGYLNHPELTHKKFFDFKISEENIVRAYRSGDLVKLTPEGEIDYIGRLDNQVKIRGFRIELGDIESNILEHPQVNNCAVIETENIEPKSLVAYIWLKPGTDFGEEIIRNYLSGKLPDYMVPSYFIFPETLPLTSSGKLDRKNLPKPSGDKAANLLAVPENSTEKRLLDLWKKLFKIDAISISDNFFDVGGNSLLAINLATLISREFNIEMNTIAIFEYPTIKRQSDFFTGKANQKISAKSTGLDEKNRRKKNVNFKKNRHTRS